MNGILCDRPEGHSSTFGQFADTGVIYIPLDGAHQFSTMSGPCLSKYVGISEVIAATGRADWTLGIPYSSLMWHKLMRFVTKSSPGPVFLNVYVAQESIPGRYDNPIPTRFLAPIDCLKIPALVIGLETIR